MERRLGSGRVECATNADELMNALERHASVRAIVCSEDWRSARRGRRAIVALDAQASAARPRRCGAGAADWLESFVPSSGSVRVEVAEEPIDEDVLDRLVGA